jgi:hypothetical protein
LVPEIGRVALDEMPGVIQMFVAVHDLKTVEKSGESDNLWLDYAGRDKM